MATGVVPWIHKAVLNIDLATVWLTDGTKPLI